VAATIALTAALVFVSYLQWRTSESTAAIERAKARPHFRIHQVNQDDQLGFVPRHFEVEPMAGVLDVSGAYATSIMEIHYTSNELRLNGRCRAEFGNFYGWTNDTLSFELNEAAARLMNYSQRPAPTSESFIRVRPMWVLIRVGYTDIFGERARQDIQLVAGMSRQLDQEQWSANSQVGIDIYVMLEPDGRLAVYRTTERRASPECEEALRVMNRIRWLRVARPDEPPQDTNIPFAVEPHAR
jgi:hypothetical protein